MLARAVSVVPARILGRMLPGRYRFSVSDVPPPPKAPAAAIRLYVAPANWAGQGWQWARAAERYVEETGAFTMATDATAMFKHPADAVVPLGAYAFWDKWRRTQYRAVRDSFSHVLVEAERRPFGGLIDQTVVGQVRMLLAEGLSVAMVCHGSDIRLPSRHAANHPDSQFRGIDDKLFASMERAVSRNRAALDALALPTFVSTPDLLLDVPYAAWLPVIIDPSLWASDDVPLERDRPVVVHAPSTGRAKGSDLIDPVMQSLHDEGLVSYRRISGVPFEQMVDVFRTADIMLDQFRTGDYGAAACEAMAAGRIVVSYVSEHARSHVKSATALDLPIVEATAGSLEAVIRDICQNRDFYSARARAGVEFVRTVHDGRLSADVLRSFLVS